MTDMAMVRSTGCDATTSLKGFRGVFGWFSRGCRSPRKVFRNGSAVKMVCVHVPDPLRNRPELPALCGPALADFPHSLVLSSTSPLPLFLPPLLPSLMGHPHKTRECRWTGYTSRGLTRMNMCKDKFTWFRKSHPSSRETSAPVSAALTSVDSSAAASPPP